jgi:hypothetical protein
MEVVRGTPAHRANDPTAEPSALRRARHRLENAMTIAPTDPRPDDALTPAQLTFFQAFGYVVLPGRLPPAQVAGLEAELLAEGERQFGGFDRARRQGIVFLEPSCPRWLDLFASGRCVTPARQILGEDCIGMGTDGNRYVGDTGWHPDSGGRPYPERCIKCCVYLSPVTATTGALRVIPGSHLQPWPTKDGLREAIASLPIAAVPAVALDSQPGDMVLFDARLWHASCGGGDDRRMGTCVYYAAPRTAEERADFRAMGEEQVRILAHCGFRSHWFSAGYLADCARSPLRAHWMEQLAELGYATAPGICEPSPLVLR